MMNQTTLIITKISFNVQFRKLISKPMKVMQILKHVEIYIRLIHVNENTKT